MIEQKTKCEEETLLSIESLKEIAERKFDEWQKANDRYQRALSINYKYLEDKFICYNDNGYDVYYTVSSEEKKDGEKAIVLDLRKEESVESLPFFFSTLDALVNNAGIFTEGKQESLPSSLFDEVFDVNMKGLFLVTKALLPLLKASDGAIVNISSMNAIHPGFGTTAHYDASKGAVSAYTRSLASETSLRVNAVAPGLIERQGLLGSELEKHWKAHTGGREMMKTEDIAKLVYFLSEARGIYGQTILIDNG